MNTLTIVLDHSEIKVIWFFYQESGSDFSKLIYTDQQGTCYQLASMLRRHISKEAS